MKLILTIAILLPFAVIFVTSIPMKFTACNDKDVYNNLTCSIQQVSVIGCKKEGKSQLNECKLRRGHNASIGIDFTPDFEGDDVKMEIFTTRPAEVLWPRMDTNACNYMICPVVKDQPTRYNYSVSVSDSYPRGVFSVRFLLSQAGTPKCCFLTKINIAA